MIKLLTRMLSIMLNMILALMATVCFLLMASVLISLLFHLLFTTNIGKLIVGIVVIILLINIGIELNSIGHEMKKDLTAKLNKKKEGK